MCWAGWAWGEAGDIWRAEGRGNHLLLVPVFKRLSNLSFYFVATDKLGSDKSDSQLASVKIATQIYAASWGFPKECKTRQSRTASLAGFPHLNWKARLLCMNAERSKYSGNFLFFRKQLCNNITAKEDRVCAVVVWEACWLLQHRIRGGGRVTWRHLLN